MSCKTMFKVLILALSTGRLNASVFLHHSPTKSVDMSAALQESLRREVKRAIGSHKKRHDDSRLDAIEEMLRPTFIALPKNQHGNLGHAGVRYILHRLFVQRHGWFVRGVEPDGEGWNSTSVGGFVEEGLPEHITKLFEEQLGNRGLCLQDIALLASTLESLVHQEAVSKLEAVYKGHRLPTDEDVPVAAVDKAIETYLASYILGTDVDGITQLQIQNMKKNVASAYPNWPQTQQFVRDIRESLIGSQNSLTFADAVSVVTEIGERYGQWQNSECLALKEELTDLSPARDKASGRVRLSDFYGGALNKGKWHFGESVNYLRQLGALDESDPADLKVIVANYIHSPSNCLASSAFYSVCCLDECESIMDGIETQLQKAEASPSQIAATIATLTPESTLTELLQARLDEIAQYHGGTVPLHGRLFAQWMHNAFPHKCAYPHMSGTTKPLRADDFQAHTGLPVSASRDEMKQFVEGAPKRRASSSVEGPWHFEEELFVSWQLVKPHERTLAATVRSLVAVLMLMSGTVGLLRTAFPATEICLAGFDAPRKRYSV